MLMIQLMSMHATYAVSLVHAAQIQVNIRIVYMVVATMTKPSTQQPNQQALLG